MSFPNFPGKYGLPSVLTAADVIRQRARNGQAYNHAPPEAVILCYQPSLMKHVLRRYRTKKIDGFFGELYLLQNTEGQVAVCGNFGLGAPVVATVMEELAASGTRRFVSVSIAGSLQQHLRPGDVVVCDRAIRDEGTSHHYLPPSHFVEANREQIEALTNAFSHRGIPFSIGSSWTTDAPYRETRAEIEHYQQGGVQTVEMEAAALYAVGQYSKVQTAAVFVISDLLAGLHWQPALDEHLVQKKIQTVFDIAVQALAEQP